MLADYPSFVRSLAKDGNLLLSEWSPSKANSIHMVMGLACELHELSVAMKEDVYQDIVEELGDLFFFSTELVRETWALNIFGAIENFLDERKCGKSDHLDNLYLWFSRLKFDDEYLVENVLSAFKSHLFYNKETPTHFVMEDLLNILVCRVCSLMEKMNPKSSFTNEGFWETLKDVLQHNVHKLSKRYPKKEFTNEDAKERKDKCS